MTSSVFSHALPFGANVQPDGTTLFRLWAPGCAAAPGLILAEGRELAMEPEGGGWYRCRTDAPAGTRYQYRITPELQIPDPASRQQAGDVHGWSVVVDPGAFAWRHPDWTGRPWHEVVLYELHVGAHAGDFDGVRNDLPRLKALGFTAVELMPVADFPGRRNWGYDGALLYAPDEAYGGAEALKRLVDAAHGEGLMVFLDVVYNHFGPDGNYLHLLAPEMFAPEVHTPWGAAIDFSHPHVRDFFIENAIYWLQEYRMDGLRFDAVHAIETSPGKGFLEELAARIRSAIGNDRHVHLVLEHDGNAARLLGRERFDAQWNDDAHHALHVLLTGERDGYYADYADQPAAHLARCLAQGFAYQGEPSPHRDGERRGEPSAHLAPDGFVTFLQNHDQIGNRAFGERLAALVPRDALKAATALVLLAPQVPLVFMGDECGTRAPFLFFTDHHGDLARAVREGRRREFARFAAFAEGGGQPAEVPDPNALATFEASCWRRDTDAAEAADMAGFYRELLRLRREAVVPLLPGSLALAADPIGLRAVRGAWRLGNGAVLQVLCNLGAEAVAVPPVPAPRPLFAWPAGAAEAVADGKLPARTTLWHWIAGA